MTVVPELLNVLTGTTKHLFPGMEQLFIPMKEVIFGALIVSFLIFEPHGLAEIWHRIKNFFTAVAVFLLTGNEYHFGHGRPGLSSIRKEAD